MIATSPPPSTISARRSLFELVGLSGLTITQPVLSTFGASPDFFVFNEASRFDIVAFAVVVALLPGLTLWLLGLLAGLIRPGWRNVVHDIALGGFLAVGLLQVTSTAGWSLRFGVPVAVIGGIGLVAARHRWQGWRDWLQWLAPAPVLFVIVFLFLSPVSALVTAGEVDPADLGAFGSGEPPPVVVMVFDEWPLSSIVRTDGSIDDQVAPNVARLAGQATWYRNTTTVSNMTNFAVPSILTGRAPQPGDRAEASSQPENLFTLLGGNYEMEVTESLTRLCPESLCSADSATRSTGARAGRLADLLDEARRILADRLGPGADDQLVTDTFVEPDAAVAEAESDGATFNLDELLAPRPERLDRLIGSIAAAEDPTLHYVHVLGPHTPHRHTPEGVRYPSDSGLRQITSPDGSPGSDLRGAVSWPAELDRQRLLLEVGYIDRLIGDVLDELEAAALFDDALIVLTSDHGLGFEPGASARGLGAGPVEAEVEPDLLWVPLLIKAPAQDQPEVSDIDARTTDILPTIAGHLGLEMPWAVDGRDLTTPEVQPRGPKQFVRVAGSSFAVFSLDDPVAITASPSDVFERGTDSLLSGRGEDRWWRVGPRPELTNTPIGDLSLGPLSDARHRLDDPGALAGVDLSSGEAPLLVAGRIELDDVPRPGEDLIAVLVDDRVAAVVPTYADGDGPGRFAAMVAPSHFVESAGVVRVAEVVEVAGETALRLIREA